MVICTSCQRETQNCVKFHCPKCNKELYRCENCRNISVNYKCVCGFEGP